MALKPNDGYKEMEKSHRRAIIIVGGGIGGLTCALALAKKGYHTLVLEQSQHKYQKGTGIIICPNAFKVFAYLGIEEAFKEISFFQKQHCYIDGLTGFNYITVPYGPQVEKRFCHPFAGCLHDDVVNTLIAECEKSPLITQQCAAKVIEVGEQNDTVYAKTNDGSIYHGEALIGCDGVWSNVRQHVVKDGLPTSSNLIVYRDVFSKEDMPQEYNYDTMRTFAKGDAHLVCYPIGKKGQCNISAICHVPSGFEEEDDLDGRREQLFISFQGALPYVQKIIEKVDISRRWVLHDREPIKEWSLGRITLLGDAAHPTLPALASGSAMAIEDAAVIAEKIAAYPDNYPLAFRVYQQERYLRTACVQLFSRVVTTVHHTSGVARELANALLSKVTADEIYDKFSYLYDGINITN